MPPRILSQLKPMVGTVFRYWSNLSRYNAVVFPALSRPSMATWSGVPVGSASRKPPLVPLLPMPAPIPLLHRLPPNSTTVSSPLTLLLRLLPFSFIYHLDFSVFFLQNQFSISDRSPLAPLPLYSIHHFLFLRYLGSIILRPSSQRPRSSSWKFSSSTSCWI